MRKALDLREKEFGRLRAKRRVADRNGQVVWLCECECGGTTEVPTKHLRAKKNPTRSCGCLKAESNRKNWWKGRGELGHDHWSAIVRNAEARGHAVELTIDQAWELYAAQGGRCALTSLPLRFRAGGRLGRAACTASLDRIDSAVGYVAGNVQWVHKVINIMKNRMFQEEFVSWCRLVVENANGAYLGRR